MPAPTFQFKARLFHFAFLPLLLCLCLGSVEIASAQTSSDTGFPQWGVFNKDQVDSINIGNFNIHFQFPVFGKKGVGLDFVADLIHDNSIWQAVPVTGFPKPKQWQPANLGASTDWNISTPVSGLLS